MDFDPHESRFIAPPTARAEIEASPPTKHVAPIPTKHVTPIPAGECSYQRLVVEVEASGERIDLLE
jgi:hypothetical protein